MTDNKPLWTKYDLSINGHFIQSIRYFCSSREVQDYIDLVSEAHDSVAQYWEAFGGKVYDYYETLKFSNPIVLEKILDWNNTLDGRIAEYKAKVDNYTCLIWNPKIKDYVSTKMKDLKNE